jgi:hypothetical protein
MNKRTTNKSSVAKAGVFCFYYTDVLNLSFPEKSGQVVHLMKFGTVKSRLRKIAKRYFNLNIRLTIKL